MDGRKTKKLLNKKWSERVTTKELRKTEKRSESERKTEGIDRMLGKKILAAKSQVIIKLYVIASSHTNTVKKSHKKHKQTQKVSPWSSVQQSYVFKHDLRNVLSPFLCVNIQGVREKTYSTWLVCCKIRSEDDVE